MKLLKADDSQGHFVKKADEFTPIDQITKEDLLRLAELALEQDEVDFDPYDEEVIKNEAHRIIYRNILDKLESLRGRRDEFIEKRDGLYRDACEQYQQDLSGRNGQGVAARPAPKKQSPPPAPVRKPIVPPPQAKKPSEAFGSEQSNDDDIPF